MSISNYSELQTAVANWLHRDDLSARVPEFIQMGEVVLNRKLRTLDMEQIATLTASTSSRFLDYPAGFIEMQALFISNDYLVSDPNAEIVYIEPSTFRDSIVTGNGQPTAYTIKDRIEFNIIPDQAYSIECRYLKKYDIASDSTNWLLTNYPDLYLHASLSAAALFVSDDSRLATFKSLTAEGIEETNNAEARKRGNGYMRCDDALNQAGAFNINLGY